VFRCLLAKWGFFRADQLAANARDSMC